MSNPNGNSSNSDADDLKTFSDKLEATKKSHEPKVFQNDRSGIGAGLKYASEFSAAVIVGAFLGYGVDKLTDSGPWGMIAGLLLGFGAGVLNVVRAAKEGMDGSGTDLPPEPDED
ncbi:AtpZ/AtpI family protein [Hellea balneolensis]|uniref:AtpZ/AtpI family protein n=1 Tax=Hellea balneolensis TaxID=287478 RepID=UPI00040E416B|nr:AtpZ/AtpI family protein [Hellea balneolensis]